ncbi:hypothetical protein LTR91_010788 [Friedmanniomyces endolithicus]|uniref:Plasma membrane proteolipid 3 n=1 Tax=Friedmanniomyces endolithicus TaxID=329885 RepID=A0AAN6QSM4_9PEZI|nr:hypothetical protein LTR75_011116 [Friedmanniomyces endolithicus]KAK0845819.1 hypothetical protein LTR03_007215 [Friedmanniomyces endolithicus]KAK0868230.1 hypothetical protein LTS02_003751 [Friedmanniomyces endolithicus]KAK0882255.1 hypothetical protein LTR87_004003 [Friedmanniomyces endolithicus]KAK0913536.1 hypothetical protein LTR57_014416 [Friedmanniomyces endolithicus]
MRTLAYRASITLINIFFPPLAVAMLCGWEWDCMLNCLLFLLAVIPSHVHGFYISCTYFHRRKKVRKGRWPGGPKALIHSDNVINGGASNAEAARLWRMENGVEGKESRRSRHNSMKRIDSQHPAMAQRQGSTLGQVVLRRDDAYSDGLGQRQGGQRERPETDRTRRSNGRPDGGRTEMEVHTARDGYGATPQNVPQRVYPSAIGPEAGRW